MLTESCVMFFRRPVLFEALFCEMNIWPRRLVLTEGGLPVVGQHWPCLVPRSCTQTSLCRWKCARAKVGHSYTPPLFLWTQNFSFLGLLERGFRSPSRTSLRSCPLPIIPLSLSREEGIIHFFVGSHVKKPESGLFSDWIGNNTDDLRCSNWPKCRHPLVVVESAFLLASWAVNTHAISL